MARTLRSNERDVLTDLLSAARPSVIAVGGGLVLAEAALGPFGLLAELTYRCPLACAYCSNPLELPGYDDDYDDLSPEDEEDGSRDDVISDIDERMQVGEGDLVAQRIHFEGTHTGESSKGFRLPTGRSRFPASSSTGSSTAELRSTGSRWTPSRFFSSWVW